MRAPLPFTLALLPGVALAISDEEKASAQAWVEWTLAAIPLLVGVVSLLITLAVIAAFIRDCLTKGTYSRMSGFALMGPIFIDFGLALGPPGIPLWVYLLPWGIEFLATAIAILVRRMTHAVPEPRPAPAGQE